MKFFILFICAIGTATACYIGDTYCKQYRKYCEIQSKATFMAWANGCSAKGTACSIVKNHCKAKDKADNAKKHEKVSACNMKQSDGANEKCFKNLGELRRSAVAATNKLRSKHGVPPVTDDKCLNGMAQAYAEKLAKMNQMKHSKGKYGENLAAGSLSTMNGKSQVQWWYDEIGEYNFNRPGYQKETGHFTQVVWKGTTKVGHGFAATPDCKTFYMVGNYDEAGNMQGAFEENVLPPRRGLKGT